MNSRNQGRDIKAINLRNEKSWVQQNFSVLKIVIYDFVGLRVGGSQ